MTKNPGQQTGGGSWELNLLSVTIMNSVVGSQIHYVQQSGSGKRKKIDRQFAKKRGASKGCVTNRKAGSGLMSLSAGNSTASVAGAYGRGKEEGALKTLRGVCEEPTRGNSPPARRSVPLGEEADYAST